jgi:hypothetical protein
MVGNFRLIKTSLARSTHTMSFVRKAKSKAASELKLLPGTILSSNQQYVTSSGIQSLDAVLGGGLQLSSTAMLVEDNISAFHTVLTNCFISEGIGQKHAILNISGHSHSEFEKFLKSLPHNSTLSGPVSRVSTSDMEMLVDFADSEADRNTVPSLSIAWQYQKYIDDSQSADPSSNLRSSRSVNLSYSGFREDIPKARVGFSNYCHSFDFSGTIDSLLLEPATLGHIEVPSDHWNRDIPLSETVGQNLAVEVLRQVEYFLSNVSSGSDPCVSRIVLHSLPPESFHEDLKQSFSKWIHLLSGLRALTRKFSAVLWVSIPEWVVSGNHEFARCVHLFDCGTFIDLLCFSSCVMWS